MLWIKSLHIIAVMSWFAALIYLPRLYVYHAMSTDTISLERFKVMERKLYYGIAWPAAIASLVFGLWLLAYGFRGGWLVAKLVLVALLIGYHLACGKLLNDFKADRNTHSHKWLRGFNEAPVLLVIGIVILVVVKPF